tara:strand:- start:7178 stop:7408 length:231 start_codon:yes stop_codon:yes gene_type:complete
MDLELNDAAKDFTDMVWYKEELNKEIAEAREYVNVDKYTGLDFHQLMKTDKQHIIEVLSHAMGALRYLKEKENGER